MNGLYLQAADEGDPTAAFNIENLEGRGVKRDVEAGLAWRPANPFPVFMKMGY